ncbi:MAG: NADH-ubiquinone oxidoreductase-F iron-sulfur binding region domain-containing protein [Polyangiaceae bacterium]
MFRAKKRHDLPDALRDLGGAKPGVFGDAAERAGVPEAEAYGVATFYHLLARPDVELRVCTGLSCRLAGADAVLREASALGIRSEGCSCLAGCDVAPAVLRGRRVLPRVTAEVLREADGVDALPSTEWRGAIGPTGTPPDQLVLNLEVDPDFAGAAFGQARAFGAEEILARIEASGLQGRGGAGFPAHIKWKSVRAQAEPTRYVVLNADEGEPGTFKDREVLLRRPDLVLEGLAIAALTVGAKDVYLYLRGEFEIPWQVIDAAIARTQGSFGDIAFHMHAGNGAYICGEETALLEALEGKRGMPRLKPPFPTERGLWGKPTLIHNVETIACVPAILSKGGEWFKALGRTEAGTKLYCVSGDVARPGTYELPLGVTLDELVAAAGGYVGELRAFSPGGASSGFLPASERGRPLDFRALAAVGSMLGSAGVVVLNDTRDLKAAVLDQLRFFEEESCGQCAPCRIGTRYLGAQLAKHCQGQSVALRNAAELAWEMNEGSICGLGQAAPLPLTSAMKYFPEEFET